MSSWEDSPAKISATQADAPAFPDHVPLYGGGYAEPFAWFDQSTLSWRTWQRCLVTGWTLFAETWPRSGMMRNGIAYRLPTLAPATSETEYGLSVTDPTPRAQGSSNAGGSNAKKKALKNGNYVTGRMNPAHQEWLMGFPIGHTEIEFSATRSSRKSRKSSAGQSCKPKHQR